MSEQEVQLARAGFEHFLATGEPDWELTGEDLEIRDHDIMDATEYRGHDGFRRWLSDWASAWSQFSMEPKEFIDGGDSVVVVLRMRATGAASGIEVDRQDAMVQRFRDGKVDRIDYFNDRGQALDAVGLA